MTILIVAMALAAKCFSNNRQLIISGSKMTGLDLMRKFPENMARPMLKKARKDLTNTYGEYFIDYTYDINSQQPVRIDISIT